jgi:hypothetical protein
VLDLSPNNPMQRTGTHKVPGRGRSMLMQSQVRLARVLNRQRAVADGGRYAALPSWFLMLLMALASSSCWSQERLIGLVEIPMVYPQETSWDIELPLGAVVLRKDPSDKASVVANIRNRKQLASAEHDYEQASAEAYGVAYGREGGVWYKLKYQSSPGTWHFGWMKAAIDNRLHLVEQLLGKYMSYMTDEWDGRVHDGPDTSAPARTVPKSWDGSHASAKLISMWGQGTGVWYLVAIMRGGACSGTPAEIVSTGWVPARTESGQSPIWYYSRGC